MQSFATTVAASLEDIEPKVRAALQEQGFGVLTEIDVAATLRAKLGVERPPLKILGAGNPRLRQPRARWAIPRSTTSPRRPPGSSAR